MALIKCSECGKEVSDKAKKCPHCGYENKKKSNVGCGTVIVIFLAISMFISDFRHIQSD